MNDRRLSGPTPHAPIRTVESFDLPKLAEVHAASFAEAWDVGSLARLFATPGTQGLLVDRPDSGEVLGFVILRSIAGEAEILTIAVRPGARRQGFARRLLRAAIACATESGALRLLLEVAADNSPALALYLGAGFAEVALRTNYYRRKGGAITALVLSKDIASTPGSTASVNLHLKNPNN
jgi:[ribosomal protein S18]-alanine N-acetyltransferase